MSTQGLRGAARIPRSCARLHPAVPAPAPSGSDRGVSAPALIGGDQAIATDVRRRSLMPAPPPGSRGE